MVMVMSCWVLGVSALPQRDLFTTQKPFVHDPAIAFAPDGTAYVFSTGLGLQLMTSRDLKTWSVSRDPVLAPIPAWTRDSVPGFRAHVWAPDIVRYRNRWWLTYSCSTFGKNTSAIGLASADSLSGPWQDQGCVIASRGHRDNYNCIDPNILIDEDGQPWMFFGSFWDGVQLVRLDSTLHVAPGAQPFTVARRAAPAKIKDVPQPIAPNDAGRNAIEAPFCIYHDGYYYLFCSYDYCCQGMRSTYRVGVGRSRSVTGPYVGPDGTPMLDGGFLPLFSGDGKVFEAAGHCAVTSLSPPAPLSPSLVPRYGKGGVSDRGKHAEPLPGEGTSPSDSEDRARGLGGEAEASFLFLCHGYSIADGGQSVLVIRHLSFTPDGWPRLVE